MGSPRRDYGGSEPEGPVPLDCKVYVGDLSGSVSKHDLEDLFGKYGRLHNIWIAKNPPGFGFVEYEDPRDSEDAVFYLDGKTVGGKRMRVELSNGRHKRKMGRGRGRPFDNNDRCFSCGRRGHYAYDCQRYHRGDMPAYGYGGSGRYGRSRSRSRSRSNRRSYSRSRSRSRSRSGERRRRRSRSPPPSKSGGRRGSRSYSRSKSRSYSRTPPRKRSRGAGGHKSYSRSRSSSRSRSGGRRKQSRSRSRSPSRG